MNNFTFNNDFNNKKPKKEETERERMARIAKTLYPTMRKAEPEWSSSACVEQDDSETVDSRDTHRSKDKDEEKEERPSKEILDE